MTWKQMKDTSVPYISMVCDVPGKYVIMAKQEVPEIEISNDYGNTFTTTISLAHSVIDISFSDDGSNFCSLSSLCVDVYRSNKITGEFSDGLLQVKGNSYVSDVYCNSLSGESSNISFDSEIFY